MELAIATILGLLIGSFLNVCIYRVPRKLSVTNPARSYCPNCETQLTWFENIPVLAWLAIGGKCRHCKAKISGQYPLVELLSGLAAAASFIYFPHLPTAAVIYALTATLIVITFIDLEFKIIPNRINYPGIVIGLGIGAISEFTQPTFFHPPVTQGLYDSVIGFLVGGGIFYVIGEIYYLATKRDGLGGGDIKFLAMTGAILGWQSVPQTIFIGSCSGAIVGILYMVIKGGGRQLEIPFGPWLSLGVMVYMFGSLEYLRF